MRNGNTKGFTLIELLIVIAIIGILAAVLIPNLLTARERAFDTAAQTCLREIANNEEIDASTDPWDYDDGTTYVGAGADPHPNGISSCTNVTVQSTAHTGGTAGTSTDTYAYLASHDNGANTYRIELGSGVNLETEGSTL